MTELQLDPLFSGEYGQPIHGANDGSGRNLCGQLPGRTQRRILIGAHYDHFRGILGADDNAAAVAIAMEVARRLHPWSGQAHIVFAFFDQEEPDYFQSPTMGSIQFVNDCPFSLDDLDCAIVLDLCGHAVPYGNCPEALFVMGAEHRAYLLDTTLAAATEGLEVLPVPHDIAPGLSDHVAFDERELPFLFLTCGRWQHYHRPTDTIEVLDLAKMGRIVGAVEAMVRHLDAHPGGARPADEPSPDYDRIAADGFHRLTGMKLPPDRAGLVDMARGWLSQVGG